jgi:ribosome-associated protein
LNWDTILSEITFRTSRSSGAGGQHVNKTESKVEVLFDVETSFGLNEEEKEKVTRKLANRINEFGMLSLSSQKSRSQFANKENVTDRLKKYLEKAIVPEVRRKKTKPSAASIEERLAEKKLRAERKASRKKPEL